MTKYLKFPIQQLVLQLASFFTFQQDNAPAHRVHETMQLSTCQTPDFIAPTLWPFCQHSWSESSRPPDLGEASLQDARCWPAGHATSKSGNISTWFHRWSDQAVASTSWSLHASTQEDILNTDFSYVWYLYRRTLRQSYVCAVAYSGHFCFGVTSLNLL